MLPLIDVIFLVLTFFIYAMVLMIPARVLPMPLQTLTSGTGGERTAAVAISITEEGNVALDREPIGLDALERAVLERVAEQPGAIVYVAWSREGDRDRLPLLGEILDRLANAGLDIRLVGAPGLR